MSGKSFFIALDSLGGCLCVSTVGQFFANGTVFVRGDYVRRHVASLRSQIFRTNPVIHKLIKHIISSKIIFGNKGNIAGASMVIPAGRSHCGCNSTSAMPMAPVTMPEMNTATIIRR